MGSDRGGSAPAYPGRVALTWDPQQYLQFADHRGRPFLDLVARIGAESPRRVVDLGCGAGNLTALLTRRWPSARIEGIDSSPDMIASADRLAAEDRPTADNDPADPGPELSFATGDIADWTPDADVDVVISNAALQWVPNHRELIRGWCQQLSRGAWLALQVPGNFGAPSHALMRDLAAEPQWRERLAGVLRHHDVVDDPIDYARLLQTQGWSTDAWETSYLHRLTGPDPVLEWVRGTGLRPVLQALPPEPAAEFETEYAARLRAAYPAEPDGSTFFPFRRIFVVGHRP